MFKIADSIINLLCKKVAIVKNLVIFTFIIAKFTAKTNVQVT